MKRPKTFQVHEHTVLNSRMSPAPKIVHSHAGGERPHQHPNCGPAFYGHGKPTFSAKPKGEPLPWVELEDWQKSFEIVICDPPKDYIGEGPGTLPAERMVKGFKMRISRIVDGRTKGGKRR